MPRQRISKKKLRRAIRQHRTPIHYPLIAFMLLCTGVFLVAWTLRATAVDIKVTGRIPGPPVTDPAIITTPVTDERFKSIPIDVAGTCPANAAYVEIFSNDVMKGAAICDGSSNFQLSIDLFDGRNDLIAHVFNITDDEGPLSDTVTVYYDAPPPPVTPPPTSGDQNPPPGTTPTGQPGSNYQTLILKTAFLYKGYNIGDKVEWPMEIIGGEAPYAINVDWGDGSSDVISRGKSGKFTISHTYSKSGDYKGSFLVKIKAADARGGKAYIQFFVIVSENPSFGAGSIFSKPPPRLGSSLHWLLVAWPAYLFVVLMVFSFLLGEREELILLKKRRLIRH